MIYNLDIKVSFWEGFMAEYSEAVLAIAKRKLMKEYLVDLVDRIVHNDIALASIQGLSSEDFSGYFDNHFEEYLKTDEGKAKLEEKAATINEAEYYERSVDEIAEEELRDQWDIAKLENYAVDHRLNPKNRSTQSPADIFDHSIYKEPDEAKRQNYIYNNNLQYETYRREWKGGEAEFRKLKAEIEGRKESFDDDVEVFIEERQPFKNRARNRAILWTVVGVAALAVGVLTIPVAISILGSAAAATGAMTIGIPAIAAGSAMTTVGVSNAVKYFRFSSLFRNLRRVATRTDSKGVSLTREMLNKSLHKVHKLANKLGIAKSELPKTPIISAYVDDYKPLRKRIVSTIWAGLSKSKAAVKYTIAPTAEEKEVKAAKATLRKAKREVRAATRSSKQADNRLRASDNSIEDMERRIAERKAADVRLKKEAEEKSIAAGFAELRNDAEKSNLDAAKRNSGKRNAISAMLNKNVRRAHKDSVKAQRDLMDAQIEAGDAYKAIDRNKMNIEAGEKRLENLKKKNPGYSDEAIARKTRLDIAKMREEEAKIEVEKALEKTRTK